MAVEVLVAAATAVVHMGEVAMHICREIAALGHCEYHETREWYRPVYCVALKFT